MSRRVLRTLLLATQSLWTSACHAQVSFTHDPPWRPASTTVVPERDESPALASLRADDDASNAHVSTLADAAARDGAALGADSLDPTLAAQLRVPPLPFRMTARLGHTLTQYRSEERPRRMVTNFVRRSGRYATRLQQHLAREGLPPGLMWVVAAESNFDPEAESSVGAGGLWQLMPDAARSYGLRVDGWLDERRDPVRATDAACRYLRDLHQRFGSWELALAAYNMGYNGLLRVIRKYNTNDFEALASLESGLPRETVQYVPRIEGLAVVAANLGAFDLASAPLDPAVLWDEVEVTRSIPLADLAREAHVDEAALRALNPALLRARTPPAELGAFTLHAPAGTGERVRAAVASINVAPTRTWTLRYGEAPDEVASRHGIRTAALLALSGLANDHTVHAGTALLVPDRDPTDVTTVQPVVPIDPAMRAPSAPANRHRVWMRLAYGDDAATVARALNVSRDDLVRWNHLDPGSRLQAGMWLQAYVASDPTTTARVWLDREVELVDRTSDLFHDRAAAALGLLRARVISREGDTLQTVADRYGLTAARLARINRIDRAGALTAGTTLVVYTTAARLDAAQ